jgi:hypothetical protein
MQHSFLIIFSIASATLLGSCNEAKDQPKEQLVSDNGRRPDINTNTSLDKPITDPRVDPTGRAPRCSAKPIYCDVPQYDSNGRATGARKEVCGWTSGECN